MKSAILRSGWKCVPMMAMAALMAVSSFAADVTSVKVNLPKDVEVGSTTLPAGQYTIDRLNGSSVDLFVIRNNNNDAVLTMPAQRVEGNGAAEKTTLTLSGEEGKWHLGTLFIEGDSTGYDFNGEK
jgi:hypothetical protein